MATQISVTAEVNTLLLEDKLENLLQDESLMLSVHNALARYCHPYVPYLHGPLSETIEVSAEGVTYTQPYARYQYYGDNFNFTKDYHPLATSRWDEAMMRDHGEEFCDEVQELLNRK